MSQADVERFVADLKSDDGLRGELSEHASGIGSVVEFAKGKGYDITADEAKDYIQAQTPNELTDDQLDAVAGGKGHHHSSTVSQTQVATVQTVAAATTEAVAAETTVNVGAEVEVVAVAAVVLT